MDGDRLQTLRGALYRRDGAAVVAALGPTVPKELPQFAGDGLLVALQQRVSGADELAAEVVIALRERDWFGDEELADELDVALGRSPRSRALQALPVDLEELSMILESGFGHDGGVVDRHTGEVWSGPAME